MLFNKVKQKIKDTISDMHEVQDARSRIGFMFMLPTTKEVRDGVKIVVDNDLVAGKCGISNRMPGGFFTIFGGEKYIVVNENAYEGPHRESIIAHELHHAKYHYDRIEGQNTTLYCIQAIFGFGDGIALEYEADEGALRSCGHGYLDFLLEAYKGCTTPALALRIRRIKKLINNA